MITYDGCGRRFRDVMNLMLHCLRECPDSLIGRGPPLIAATDWSVSTPSPAEVVDKMLKEIGGE